MTQEEVKYFEDFKTDIVKELGNPTIDDIPNFPFSSYSDYLNNVKDINFITFYSYERMMIYSTKKEKFIHHLIMTLPLLLIISAIVITILLGSWFYLWSILAVLLGFYFLSSPFNPLTRPLYMISSLLFVVSFFVFDFKWTFLIGSFAFAQYFGMFIRIQFIEVIKRRSQLSEVFLIWFATQKILRF